MHRQQVFVLVAKGWTITQEYFAPSEWRGIILTLSAFYMTNSVLLVLQVLSLSTRSLACVTF